MSPNVENMISCVNKNVIKVESEEERRILDQFQKRIGSFESDATLLRFLRARDYNLDKSEEMLRKCLEWRKITKSVKFYSGLCHSFFQNPCHLNSGDRIMRELQLLKYYFEVAWLPLGRWRGRHLVEGGKKEDCLQAAYYMFELCLQHVRNSGNRPCFVIFGMEELSFYQISHLETMQTFFYGFQQLEQNYPEILRKLYVINAPWIFATAFAFVKPVMSARTLAKIEVHGSDKNKWLPMLLDSMPRDVIPPEYLE